MDPVEDLVFNFNRYMRTVHHCLFENCSRQYNTKNELQKHLEDDHFNNREDTTRDRVILQPRRRLQPLNMNVPIVARYDDAGVFLGGRFRAVAGGDMSDSAKAKKYMKLLRVPNYEMCDMCTMAPCLWVVIEERDVECIPDEPSDPSERNHQHRKSLYREAWATLGNLGYYGLKVTCFSSF